MVMSINYWANSLLDRAFILHDYLHILIISYVTNFIPNISSSVISKNGRRHGDFNREIGPKLSKSVYQLLILINYILISLFEHEARCYITCLM